MGRSLGGAGGSLSGGREGTRTRGGSGHHARGTGEGSGALRGETSCPTPTTIGSWPNESVCARCTSRCWSAWWSPGRPVGPSGGRSLRPPAHRRRPRARGGLPDAHAPPRPEVSERVIRGDGRPPEKVCKAPPLPPHYMPAIVSWFVGREAETAAVSSLFSACRLVTLTGPGEMRQDPPRAPRGRAARGDAPGRCVGRRLCALWRSRVGGPDGGADPGPPGRAMTSCGGDAGRDPAMEGGPSWSWTPASTWWRPVGPSGLTSCLRTLGYRCWPPAVSLSMSRASGWGGSRRSPSRGSARGCPSTRSPGPMRSSCSPSASPLSSDFRLTRESAEAVCEICRRLDGLPLAIELAAAQVKALSVHQIAARLDALAHLVGTASPAVAPRHRTLEAACDWNDDLLSDPGKRLLRQLTVFAGGWTLEAASHVCGGNGLDSAQVLSCLANLVDKSPVEGKPGGGRRTTASWRSWGRPTTPGCTMRERRRLCGCVWPTTRPKADGGWSNFSRGPRSPRWTGRALEALGSVASDAGDHETARPVLEEALAIVRHHGDALGRARAPTTRSVVAMRQADHQGARASHRESLALYRELGDSQGAAYALNNLGLVEANQGRLREARRAFEESLALLRQVSDVRGDRSHQPGERPLPGGQARGGAVRLGGGPRDEEAPEGDPQPGGAAGGGPGLAAAERAAREAVHLFGAAEAAARQNGLPSPLSDHRAHHLGQLAALGAFLGEEVFQAAWASASAPGGSGPRPGNAPAGSSAGPRRHAPQAAGPVWLRRSLRLTRWSALSTALTCRRTRRAVSS